MNNYFRYNSLEIKEMFCIKDNFIYHKDFCLIFKDFSMIPGLFNEKFNSSTFQDKSQFSRTFQDCTNHAGAWSISHLRSFRSVVLNLRGQQSD